MTVIATSLSDWLETPQGQYLLAREQAFFDRAVADIFGFNALQLGLPRQAFLRASRMPLRAVAGDEPGVQLRLLPQELPLETGSLDLLLLPHVLEFNDDPHQILREAERVLRAEGELIISGFNPLSLWGARRALGCRSGPPWNGDFIALTRLKDWLALLDFEISGDSFACYAPPFVSVKWLQRFHFMEPSGDRWWAVCGGVYFLHAKKRVPGMRLLKPRWKQGLVSKLLPVAPKLNREANQQIQKDD